MDKMDNVVNVLFNKCINVYELLIMVQKGNIDSEWVKNIKGWVKSFPIYFQLFSLKTFAFFSFFSNSDMCPTNLIFA